MIIFIADKCLSQIYMVFRKLGVAIECCPQLEVINCVISNATKYGVPPNPCTARAFD
jgi:hypothetical protein